MQNLKHLKFDPLNLKKRFVYTEAVPPIPEDIARGVARRELMKSIPDALKQQLTPEKLEALRKTVGASGRRAAEAAVRNLGSSVTEAQARVAAEAAFRQAAAQEVSAAQNLAQQATKTAAERVATESARRAAARQAAARAAQRGLPQAAQRALPQLARGAAQTTRLLPTAAGAETTALAEAAGASVGITAAAVLAAVVGVAAASWQTYELYKDTKGFSEWEGEEDVRDRLKRDSVTPWKVENIDSTKERQGDLPAAVEQTGSWLRGAAKLGRDTASTLLVEAKSYGDGSVDKKISDAKINQMIDYAKEVGARIEDLSHKPEINPASPEYREAETAYRLILTAIEAAQEAMKRGRGGEQLSKYKLALSDRDEARFRRDLTTLTAQVDGMEKSVDAAKSADEALATKILTELNVAKTQLAEAENGEQLKPAQKLIAAQQANIDKLVLKQKKALELKEEVVPFIYSFLRTKIPAEHRTPEFTNRVMQIALAQLPDAKEGKISSADFLARLNAVFPDPITPESYALQNDGYFKEDEVPDGLAKGKKRFNQYLWHPESQAYVLGLVARVKSIPALASSQQAYIDELNKIMNDPAFRENANKMWVEKGEAGFYSYVISSLPSPEKFFGYSAEEEAKKSEKATEKKRPAGGARIARGGGTGGKVPGAAPSLAELLNPSQDTASGTSLDRFRNLPQPLRTAIGGAIVSYRDKDAATMEAKVRENLAGKDVRISDGEYMTPAGVRVKIVNPPGSKDNSQVTVTVTGVSEQGNAAKSNPGLLASVKTRVDKNGVEIRG
jgi:hypothetical protein